MSNKVAFIEHSLCPQHISHLPVKYTNTTCSFSRTYQLIAIHVTLFGYYKQTTPINSSEKRVHDLYLCLPFIMIFVTTNNNNNKMCDVYFYHSQKLLCLRWFNTYPGPATAATFFRFVVSHQSPRITCTVSMQPRTMEYHNTTQVDNLTQRTIALRTLLFPLIFKSSPPLFSLPQFQTSFVLV